jgi:hypothetical protein
MEVEQMNRRAFTLSLAATLALGTASAETIQAGGPTRVSDSYTDRFFDDFIAELCGIETFTTLTERWTFTEFADGSATLHVVRTFVPDDPRIPIEKGAGTSFIAPDGSRVVVGSPTRLFDLDGGIRLIDAGRTQLDENDDVVSVSGQLASFDVDLAQYYCP